jgi:hypothetical protein
LLLVLETVDRNIDRDRDRDRDVYVIYIIIYLYTRCYKRVALEVGSQGGAIIINTDLACCTDARPATYTTPAPENAIS